MIPAKVCQISVSKGEKHCHAACVTSDGELWTWGDKYKGQLGTLKQGWDHSIKDCLSLPAKVDLPNVVQVACGGIHNSAITQDGSLYTWGCGSDGRLGHPEYEGHTYLYKESLPKKVEALRNVKDVCSSYYSMGAIAD